MPYLFSPSDALPYDGGQPSHQCGGDQREQDASEEQNTEAFGQDHTFGSIAHIDPLVCLVRSIGRSFSLMIPARPSYFLQQKHAIPSTAETSASL